MDQRSEPRKTKMLGVMNRETDVIALLAAQRTLKRTDMLVWAHHNQT